LWRAWWLEKRREEIEGYRQNRMKSGELIYRTREGGRSNIIILFSKFEEGMLRYVTVKGAAEDRPAGANSNQKPINSPDFLVSSAGPSGDTPTVFIPRRCGTVEMMISDSLPVIHPPDEFVDLACIPFPSPPNLFLPAPPQPRPTWNILILRRPVVNPLHPHLPRCPPSAHLCEVVGPLD